MITYDPHHWGSHFFDIKGSMVREILGRVMACTLWSAVVVAIERYVRPVGIPTSVHSLVSFALSLLLVFRTNASYDRFWEGRRLWGGIINETRNLARASRVFLKEDRVLFGALIRWTIAFAYAAMYRLRGEASIGPMAGVLPREEVESALRSPHVPLAVAGRISEVLSDARTRGLISDYVQIMLDQNVQQLIDYLGGCERIRRTPLPFAYMVHLRRALLLYCFTLPFALVRDFGWGTVLVTFMISYIFFGIEEIGVEIEDPFGCDVNDLPLEGMCETIETNLTGGFLDDSERPVPHEPERRSLLAHPTLTAAPKTGEPRA